MATSIEEWRQRFQLERGLIARLQTANIRFTDAQIERIWAIESANFPTRPNARRFQSGCDAALTGCNDRGAAKLIVNLRPVAYVETKVVVLTRPRVVRVLERIAADLDNLSLVPNDPHAAKKRTTMILEHVIAMSWPSYHGSRRSCVTKSSGRRCDCEQRWDYCQEKQTVCSET